MAQRIINIIDRDFNYLGQIDNYSILMLGKSYHGISSCELHLQADAVNADKLVKENIIFTATNKAYVILYRERGSKDNTMIIKGLDIKSYLSRLLTYPPTGQAYHRINSNIETIMKDYVTAQLTRKGINNIRVATNQNRGTTTVFQTRMKNLAAELEKLSILGGLGWDVVLDLQNKKFVFDIVEGKDRSINQSINPPAIFSTEYDNIGEQTLIESKLSYGNVAVVAGQGEGALREFATVGTATGLDAFEIFVDARDISNSADLPARGQQRLSELQEIKTFDSEVYADKNLRYEEDFNLGDIITMKNTKWNITEDSRITAITEIYESTGFRLDISFGEGLPTVADILKHIQDDIVD